MSKRKKILWLVSWYPNKYDPFDGDFIQRHAIAASLYDDIHVFFIRFAEEQEEVQQVMSGQNGLTEQILYLPKKNGLWGKLNNYLLWKKVYQAQLSLLIHRQRPDLVHVHVPWKAGLMALLVKKRFSIPFLLTEHWGLYNPVVDDNITTKPFFFRWMLKKIFREAAGFVTVSHFLGEGVNRLLLRKKFTVIPNVVNTNLFFPVPEKAARFTFLHVSNMVPLKNVSGILNAFQLFLAQSGVDAQLVLVGNRNEGFSRIAQEMGLLNKAVFFRGEIPYHEVAREMQKAHVLVLNSVMENSPCVIGEALCCGLPMIATNVGGIPELVTPENSLLVPPHNDTALATAFLTIYEKYEAFKHREIAAAAMARFSMPVVGQQHHHLYS